MLLIYDSTPDDSVLRQLCSLGLTIACASDLTSYTSDLTSYTSDTRLKDKEIFRWKSVLCKHAELGWQYFWSTQKKDRSFSTGGACRFHDHSDICGWKREITNQCLYPDAASLAMEDDVDVLMHGQSSCPSTLKEGKRALKQKKSEMRRNVVVEAEFESVEPKSEAQNLEAEFSEICDLATDNGWGVSGVR